MPIWECVNEPAPGSAPRCSQHAHLTHVETHLSCAVGGELRVASCGHVGSGTDAKERSVGVRRCQAETFAPDQAQRSRKPPCMSLRRIQEPSETAKAPGNQELLIGAQRGEAERGAQGRVCRGAQGARGTLALV